MKNNALIIFLLLTITLLVSSPLIDNLRFSAPTSDNQVIAQGELNFFYDISFYYFGEDGVEYQTFEPIEGSATSHQVALPAPVNGDVEIGIRAYNDVLSETDAGVAIQAISWDGENDPEVADLNWLSNDATDDTTIAETFLDITATHFTYSDEKLYFSMQNNGGGFPVSEAIWGPFYSYISLIIPSGLDLDPTNINITPFGILYTVNQAGIIQPGLYKVSGMTMNDIEFVAPIESSIDEANNQLTLSCNWSDLYAQEDFLEWFDPENPQLTTASGTGMITLAGGMQETDFTYPSAIYLDPLVLEEQENILPEVTNINPYENDGYLYFTYYDENGNFPLTAQAIINDGEEILDFSPLSYDFSTEVTFQSNETSELISTDWSSILVKVSDNNINFTEELLLPTSNDNSIEAISLNSIQNYPNPFNPETRISFTLDKASPVKLNIFNIKGQKVFTLLDEYSTAGKHEVVWNGTNDKNESLASGIYFIQMQTEGQSVNHKMVLMK